MIIPITTAEYVTKAKRPQNSGLSIDKLQTVLSLSIRSWQTALREFIKTELKYDF